MIYLTKKQNEILDEFQNISGVNKKDTVKFCIEILIPMMLRYKVKKGMTEDIFNSFISEIKKSTSLADTFDKINAMWNA